jgi:hypothetical protein
VVAACAVSAPALAGNVDITKNRDSHVTVWNTLLGFRYGDPVYDGTLPAGHRLQISEGWLTDLSVVQDPLAAGLHRTTTGMAMITGGPGTYTMPDLTQAVGMLAGPTGRIGVPDLASSFFDVFVTIDLDDFVHSGGGALPLGTSLSFLNGDCVSQPGLHAGLSDYMFSAGSGWQTGSPFSGELTVIGEMGLSLVPAPGTAMLGAMGGLLALRRKRRS